MRRPKSGADGKRDADRFAFFESSDADKARENSARSVFEQIAVVLAVALGAALAISAIIAALQAG